MASSFMPSELATLDRTRRDSGGATGWGGDMGAPSPIGTGTAQTYAAAPTPMRADPQPRPGSVLPGRSSTPTLAPTVDVPRAGTPPLSRGSAKAASPTANMNIMELLAYQRSQAQVVRASTAERQEREAKEKEKRASAKLSADDMPVAVDMFLVEATGNLQAEVREIRQLVEKHRARLRTLDEEGVSRQMLTAATQYRLEGTRNLMQRAIDEMTGQFNVMLATKTDVETTAKLDRAKVDWDKLRDTILQLTRRFIYEYVEAETERLKNDVKTSIEKVFQVDPTLRADMESVSRLSKRCEEAVNEAQRLSQILDAGVEGMIKKAQAAMGAYTDELIEKFRAEARSVQAETLSALENCEERLTAKIEAGIEGMQEKAEATRLELIKSIDGRLAELEQKIMDQFRDVLDELKATVAKCEEICKKCLREVDAIKGDVKTLQKEMRGLTRQQQRNTMDITNNRLEINTIHETLKTIKADMASMNTMIYKNKSEIESNAKQHTKLVARFERVLERVAELEKQQRQGMGDIMDKFNEEIKKVKTQFREREKQMTSGLNSNKSDLRAVERRMEREMFGTITSLKRDLETLTDKTTRNHQILNDKVQLQAKSLKEVGQDSGGLETHTNQQFWFMQQAMSKLEQKMVVMSKRARGGPTPHQPRRSRLDTTRNLVKTVARLQTPKDAERELKAVQRLTRTEADGVAAEEDVSVLAEMRTHAKAYKDERERQKREHSGRPPSSHSRGRRTARSRGSRRRSSSANKTGGSPRDRPSRTGSASSRRPHSREKRGKRRSRGDHGGDSTPRSKGSGPHGSPRRGSVHDDGPHRRDSDHRDGSRSRRDSDHRDGSRSRRASDHRDGSRSRRASDRRRRSSIRSHRSHRSDADDGDDGARGRKSSTRSGKSRRRRNSRQRRNSRSDARSHDGHDDDYKYPTLPAVHRDEDSKSGSTPADGGLAPHDPEARPPPTPQEKRMEMLDDAVAVEEEALSQKLAQEAEDSAHGDDDGAGAGAGGGSTRRTASSAKSRASRHGSAATRGAGSPRKSSAKSGRRRSQHGEAVAATATGNEENVTSRRRSVLRKWSSGYIDSDAVLTAAEGGAPRGGDAVPHPSETRKVMAQVMTDEQGAVVNVLDPESSKANVEMLVEATQAMGQAVDEAADLAGGGGRPHSRDMRRASIVAQQAGAKLNDAMEESMASLSAALIQADRYSTKAGIACDNASQVASHAADAAARAEAGARAVEEMVSRAAFYFKSLMNEGAKHGAGGGGGGGGGGPSQSLTFTGMELPENPTTQREMVMLKDQVVSLKRQLARFEATVQPLLPQRESNLLADNEALQHELERSQRAHRSEMVQLAEALARGDPGAMQWVRDHAPEAGRATSPPHPRPRTSSARMRKPNRARTPGSPYSGVTATPKSQRAGAVPPLGNAPQLARDRIGPNTQVWTRPPSSDGLKKRPSLASLTASRRKTSKGSTGSRVSARKGSRGATARSGGSAARTRRSQGGIALTPSSAAASTPANARGPLTLAQEAALDQAEGGVGWDTGRATPASPIATPTAALAGRLKTPGQASPQSPAPLLEVSDARAVHFRSPAEAAGSPADTPKSPVKPYDATAAHQRESRVLESPTRHVQSQKQARKDAEALPVVVPVPAPAPGAPVMPDPRVQQQQQAPQQQAAGPVAEQGGASAPAGPDPSNGAEPGAGDEQGGGAEAGDGGDGVEPAEALAVAQTPKLRAGATVPESEEPTAAERRRASDLTAVLAVSKERVDTPEWYEPTAGEAQMMLRNKRDEAVRSRMAARAASWKAYEEAARVEAAASREQKARDRAIKLMEKERAASTRGRSRGRPAPMPQAPVGHKPWDVFDIALPDGGSTPDSNAPVDGVATPLKPGEALEALGMRPPFRSAAAGGNLLRTGSLSNVGPPLTPANVKLDFAGSGRGGGEGLSGGAALPNPDFDLQGAVVARARAAVSRGEPLNMSPVVGPGRRRSTNRTGEALARARSPSQPASARGSSPTPMAVMGAVAAEAASLPAGEALQVGSMGVVNPVAPSQVAKTVIGRNRGGDKVVVHVASPTKVPVPRNKLPDW